MMETLFIGGPMDGDIRILPDRIGYYDVLVNKGHVWQNPMDRNGQLSIKTEVLTYIVKPVLGFQVAYAPGWE